SVLVAASPTTVTVDSSSLSLGIVWAMTMEGHVAATLAASNAGLSFTSVAGLSLTNVVGLSFTSVGLSGKGSRCSSIGIAYQSVTVPEHGVTDFLSASDQAQAVGV